IAIGAYAAEIDARSDAFHTLVAGQVYIFFGPMSGSYTPEDADSIHSGPDVGLLGQVVAGGGDLLGTGTSTLILPVYPVSRGSDIVRLLTMGGGDSTAPDVGASVWGPASPSSFGSAVDGSGDVNGDGFADLVVGAPNFTGATDLNGAIYVFAGPVSEFTTVDDAIFWVEGEVSGDALGFSVGSGGDWNDDGFMDIAVGAPGTGETSGTAYVIEGGASLGSGTASSVATAILSGMDGKMGSSIALDGDVDGDGYSDALVGAPHTTGDPESLASVGIFFGGSSGVWDATDVAIEASSPEDLAGSAVSYIGDALGLGVDSFAIGGSSASHGEGDDAHRVGTVWIFNSGF
ncbi:MAG: integrin alpha, partial [Myxococcota bacterium]